MVTQRRKKNTRMHAKTTHGWGSMKKRRGAGHRGGRGNAGSGKRGDAKKPSYWAKKHYMGKRGFKKHNSTVVKAITLKTIDTSLIAWKAAQKITEEQGVYHIDLTKLGYTKVLSTGQLTEKVQITAEAATPKAIEKVKAAGGSIVLPSAE